MKRIPKNKFPSNDRLTREFYEIETFLNELKDSFINSMKLAYQEKALSTCQHQAVTKIIEKKDCDKILLENWRPMSLVNVDLTRGKPQIPSSSFLGFLIVSRSSYNN